jgi:VIT1/CCC1 family predicted Fe2+/Mn2+ transporter
MFGSRLSNRLLAAVGSVVVAALALAALATLLTRALFTPQQIAAAASLGLVVVVLAAVIGYSVTRPA